MEAILPHNTQDREHFSNCAMQIGFDEFVIVKFIFTMQDSDLDVFPLMGNERISQLLYGWQTCESHLQDANQRNVDKLPDNLLTILKRLTYYTLDVWFSKEWERCHMKLKNGLLFCLKRVQYLFEKIPELSALNWNYLLHLHLRPWQMEYLNGVFECCRQQKLLLADSIEHVEETASIKDIDFFEQEGPILIILRLIKMFDAGAVESVKHTSMRMIAAWNAIQKERAQSFGNTTVSEEQKRCLLLICHIYLIAVYEMDDIRGFIIDNLMNNIRFYCRSLREQATQAEFAFQDNEYTAARYIALTCARLQLSSNEFYKSFISESFDERFTTLFGVVSQAYNSYLLGNLLMVMNNMNEENFSANLANFKSYIKMYVVERERSESFMLRELKKQKMQRTSHNVPITIKDMSDFSSKLCKGNRMSNIGSCEQTDIAAEELDDLKSEAECDGKQRRIDPVFQNIPNNERVLSYVYNVIAKRNYKGWHFAKLVLLLKIIGHELNVIETWRYHPGLTADFMLNLEIKLARNYEDLAHIFQEYFFMEQEFWLTAFYLHPCRKYYDAVIRCGMRYNRKRDEAQKALETGTERNERGERRVREKLPLSLLKTKFGLLSSTIDVQEIVAMTNHDTPTADYDQLDAALRAFQLPEHIIKDLLTITFLPRNRSFAWAVNWQELRKRCRMLLDSNHYKRRLVELNMAEANDRLKYLKINYEKYKNRPQLDYGSIEEGYEGTTAMHEHTANVPESEEEVDEDDDDYENDYKEQTKRERANYKKKDEYLELTSDYFMGTRRTRARTAAVIASTIFKDGKRSDNDSDESDDERMFKMERNSVEQATEKAMTTSVSLHNETQNTTEMSMATTSTAATACETKRSLKDWLEQRHTYNNATDGFKLFPDIWNIKAGELHTIENEQFAPTETETLLKKFARLKSLKKTTDVKTTEESTESAELTDSSGSDTSTTALPDLSNIIKARYSFESTKDKSYPIKHAYRLSTSKAGENAFDSGSDDDASFVENVPIRHSPKTLKLIKECTQKQLQVKLHRLTVADFAHLRQPTVHLRRLSLEKYNQEQAAKRRCMPRKVYIDSDESNKSSSGSSFHPEQHTQRALKSIPARQATMRLQKRSFKRSSSASSSTSEEYKSKRRIVVSAATTSLRERRLSSSRRAIGGALTVTPRSASGLKLRISTAGTEEAALDDAAATTNSSSTSTERIMPTLDECIQISTTPTSNNNDDVDADTETPPTCLGLELVEVDGTADESSDEEEMILCD